MSTFLSEFENVIRNCSYSNTYKMAWAKAIVEASTGKEKDEVVKISLVDLGEKMFKYYWDQTIYFHLYQSAPNQPPVILQEVQRIIDLYQTKMDDNHPVKFIIALDKFDDALKHELTRALKKVVSNINLYVKERFLYLGKRLDFYTYDKKAIYMSGVYLRELHARQQDLFDLINYRWSLMLEDYNSSPRIGKKVRIMDEEGLERSNSQLKKFDEYLDAENHDHICFICHKKISEGELSRDHVIPWSFMCSDDLWNLVYVHKSCNSKKSDRTPSAKAIDDLKVRNKRLQELLHKMCEEQGVKLDSNIEKLDLAIEKDYVEQFYLACKGC